MKEYEENMKEYEGNMKKQGPESTDASCESSREVWDLNNLEPLLLYEG